MQILSEISHRVGCDGSFLNYLQFIHHRDFNCIYSEKVSASKIRSQERTQREVAGREKARISYKI